MNHDEQNPDLQPLIESDLEARLVAAVLGEASAFETAELERLIMEKPELGIFKRRIEAVQGLVATAVRPEQAPLRLAPERRAKILQTIGAVSEKEPAHAPPPAAPLVFEPKRNSFRERRKKLIWGSGLAASFTLAAFFAASSFRKIHVFSLDGAEQSFPLQLAATVNQSEMEADREKRAGERAFDLKSKAVESHASAPLAFKRAALPTLEEQTGAASAPAPWRGGLSFGIAVPRGSARGGGAAGKTEIAPKQRFDEARLLADGDRAARFGALRQETLPGIAPKEKDVAGLAPIAPDVENADKAFSASSLLTLSPFEVSSSRDRGYAAGNTLSGARVRTNLSDLASSISVVTKQSLTDTAALNRNERFADDSFLAGSKTGDALNFTELKKADLPASAASVDEFLSRQNVAALTSAQPSAPAEAPQGELSAAQEPVSTFSLHVSDVSFRLAQAALARGETPDPTRIRPEEFYNAFDYGDPSPAAADKISCRIEQAAHPLLQQRNLVRIAMKVPATGRGAGQPLRLTVLLDTSGSMERADRILSVRRALEVLASLLGANDRVTLIGFARQPRLLAEQLPGNQAAQLIELAANTPFTGGTNLEEALKLSGELARRARVPSAQNRIVLLTDGAANLGNANPAELAKLVETLRQQGIAFDACGVGTDGLDDSVLEALTRKGDGRYYVLDKAEDADAGFARQLAGAFRPAAENVKVQVRFNPARVGSYRLIGFEQHRLREEDFRNDQVDAAELAAEEAAVAVYQVQVLPQGEGELGEVFVRFRDAATATMVERSWTIAHEPRARAFDRAAPTLQLAGTAALLAEKLRGGPAADLLNLEDLAPTVNGLRGHYAQDARVQELLAMFEQMRRRGGK